MELRTGLAPFELERLKATRERATNRNRALKPLGERFGLIAVPEGVRECGGKAHDELMRWVAAMTSRYEPGAVEAIVEAAARIAQWLGARWRAIAPVTAYHMAFKWMGRRKSRRPVPKGL